MIYLFLMGVHPRSVHLMGGCLMGVYPTGLSLRLGEHSSWKGGAGNTRSVQ
jgi:hypothetical protein